MRWGISLAIEKRALIGRDFLSWQDMSTDLIMNLVDAIYRTAPAAARGSVTPPELLF